MNTTPPIFCGTLLAAMLAAGLAYYWSVERLMTSLPGVPVRNLAAAATQAGFETRHAEEPLTVVHRDPSHPIPVSTAEGINLQTEVLQRMLAQLKTLKTENNDLLDQLAETNRNVLKLQFQVDSKPEDSRSRSHRSERAIQGTSYPSDDSPGVLPPKAMSVSPLEQ